MYEDLNRLFTLRVPAFKGEPMIVIHAWDANHVDSTGHARIDVEVRQGGKVIFARGDTWCAVNGSTSLDGIAAKELVMSLVAMKPGDTDADYFAGYSADQLEWCERYGEHIGCERYFRYCDENGSVKGRKR